MQKFKQHKIKYKQDVVKVQEAQVQVQSLQSQFDGILETVYNLIVQCIHRCLLGEDLVALE